jgi:uncharacterized membrane protein YgcG
MAASWTGSWYVRALTLAFVVAAASLVVAVGRQPEATDSENLIEDPGFESGTSGFSAQDPSSSVSQSAEAPLSGANSLRVSTELYGANLWWTRLFAGGRATRLRVAADLRSDLASPSALQFCAMAYYADNTIAVQCAEVPGSRGAKGRVSSTLAIDGERRLASVRLRMYQEGAAPIRFTLDNAEVILSVVEMPPTNEPPTGGGGGDGGGGGGGGGDGGGGSAPDACTPSTSGRYPGFTYALPATRPFISLEQFSQAQRNSAAFARFRTAVDAAVAGSPPYAYSATDSVLMYRLTKNAKYIDDAIARVESVVGAAEAAIARGQRPAIAGDSYLEVGWYLEQLALTYDAGYDRLTGAQRERWPAFAEQTLRNLWNPASARWGDTPAPWTGWSICDPGNNYHFSFLRATMFWALASKSEQWLTFLQTQKFGPLVDYYAQLPGGGSREGTGYGTAQKNLFDNYLYWRHSTGEDLAALTSHARDTIDYWIHATVPTRDRFAPIGDQSREAIPTLYDYHENLVHSAVVLSRGTPQARRGTWWLRNNSVNGVAHSFNLLGDLLPYPDEPEAPVERVYHASGAGVVFARSNWNTDATWVAVVAGKYDQSHAHQDQGAFTLFRRDWLAVTSNIWSNSGINQEVDVHNVLRFERGTGAVIPQSPSDTVQSTMTVTTQGDTVTMVADLSNAYWRNREVVQSWTRTLEFTGNTLRVTDACRVAGDVRPVFQLHVPVQPTQVSDGSVRAGDLLVVPRDAGAITWTAMPGPTFSRGYRIEVRPAAGCAFSLELRAQ